MHRRAVFAVALITSVLATATMAPAIVWTPLGPDGGTIEVLAVDPLNPATVYAASVGGVRKSTDGGITWVDSSVGLGSALSITKMVIDPVNPNVLYVGGSLGKSVYKTTDGGAHWNPAHTGLPVGDFTTAGISVLAIDPLAPTTVYAVVPGGFYKTTNGGSTWSHLTTNGVPGVGSNTYTLTIDPFASTLYAGNAGAASPNLVVKSSNGGVTWTGAGNGLPDAPFGLLRVVSDPVAPDTVYATFCGDGVYKTIDGGANWTPLSTGLPASACVLALGFDPASPSTIYAAHLSFGVASQIFKSIDGGATWSGNVPTGTAPNALATGAPGRALVGTNGSGVLRTIDGGANWVPSNAGLQNHVVYGIAVDPVTPATMYLGTDGAFYKSIDTGTTWVASTDPLFATGAGPVVVDPSTPATIYAGAGGGIVKSIDAGASWTLCPGSSIPNVHVIAIDPAAPSHIFVGSYATGVHRSLDGCASWAPANVGLGDDPYTQAVVVAPGAPSTLYAAMLSTGIFRSDDTGASWYPVNNGYTIPGDGFPRILAVDPLVPTTLYGSIGDHMYKTTNGGTNWILSSTGLPTEADYRAIVVDPVHPSRVFVGNEGFFADGFVYGSFDGGQSWSPFTADIQNPGIEFLAIDPAGSSRLFAGTNGSSVFVRNTVCTADADCDDGNPCTTNTCNPSAPEAVIGGCVFTEIACPEDACNFSGSCDTDTGLCVREPKTGESCQDGDPCTYDTCSDEGMCVGALVPSPLCRIPVLSRASSLSITNGADDTRDKVVWQWKKGQATSLDDLGDPTSAASYRLCIFDTFGGAARPLDALAPAGGTCGGKPCWTLTNSGAHYRNKGGAGNGIEQIRVKPGLYGFSRVSVKGRGPNLLLPARPMSPAVTVQLVRADDQSICWKATFNTGITRQDATTFRAKSD